MAAQGQVVDPVQSWGCSAAGQQKSPARNEPGARPSWAFCAGGSWGPGVWGQAASFPPPLGLYCPPPEERQQRPSPARHCYAELPGQTPGSDGLGARGAPIAASLFVTTARSDSTVCTEACWTDGLGGSLMPSTTFICKFNYQAWGLGKKKKKVSVDMVGWTKSFFCFHFLFNLSRREGWSSFFLSALPPGL